MMKSNSILLVIVALIIGAGAGFFGGMKYQESKVPSFAGAGMQNGQFGQFQNGERTGTNGTGTQRARSGFRPVAGDIISADATSITVKLQDGSTKIVLLTDKTVVNKTSTASKNDLKTGEKVSVFGTENTDGSVSATNIQLNPMR